ncbi:MAG TPA: hypothetical protein VFX15_04270 [Actinomycetes bacterium]|nr:hypothetical protein [Actinomycetes bacterium]
MKQRLALALAAGLFVTLAVPGVASAAQPPWGEKNGEGPPIGGCPHGAAGWMLVQPSGPEHLSAAYDFNGDGWVCGAFTPGLDGASVIIFMDNVVR